MTKQYYQGKKKLRFLTLFILLIAITLHAEEHDYGQPVSVCLNKHTIPYINTMIPAENIVNDAYLTCQGVVDEWNRERESLPKEMVIKQNKELRDMYIRMIEIRRKASAHKK
ncbi:hypothetical protein [Enterobacter roggenkampii]|uniref:hypothetical protein n=1 Tax=Enterobacter roggenkampii TaxID=1812935 RepID=UPI001E59596F|nr:hypothetical protein [Enterobacter roggenkampii]MCK6908742.1 hypothetical protein [Enterobacter roggenkampii]MCK7200369.1 hypothetical protein [Enterobacter roggenkampii]